MSTQIIQHDVVVIGGGPVGSLAAAYMAMRGFKVDVYEGRPDSRKESIVQGKSINLAVSERGLTALRHVHVDQEVCDAGLPMFGRALHKRGNRNLEFQQYGRPDQHLLSVSRRLLNEVVMTRAEQCGNVTFHFRHRCVGVSLADRTVTFEGPESGSSVTVKATLFIAADGAYSAIRAAFQKTDRFQYQQEYITHGYKELCIPAAANGEFAMDATRLHIWPRHEYMLIGLPNKGVNDFTCTLFLPFSNKNKSNNTSSGNDWCFDNLKTADDVSRFFETEFPDAVPLIPDLREAFFKNPTSSLVTVRCEPHYMHNFLLIGDAAHAVVPFYGQGCNAGFEDVYVLNGIMESMGFSPATASDPAELDRLLNRYATGRKRNADAVASLALQNFEEMKSHTAKDSFLLKKAFERTLYELFPSSYIPLYVMVSFTTIPYADAIERAAKQGAVIRKLARATTVATLTGLGYLALKWLHCKKK